MGNFAEAIKTDMDLQKNVADAIKNVAEANGHTIDEKAYGSNTQANVGCANTCDSYCLCTL